MRTLFHNFKQQIKKRRLPLLLELIKWLLIDLYRRLRDGPDLRVYGVYAFVGIHGKGKTMSMVAWIERQLKRVPELAIYTNFHYDKQTGPLEHWTEMLEIAERGNAIIAIDEAHTSFNSRSWKDFPIELIDLISQNRKDGVQLLLSSQVFDSIEKTIRDQTHYVVSCKNLGKRLFLNIFYRTTEYNKSPDKRKVSFRQWYVAADSLRESYNTFLKIKSLRNYQKQDTVKTEVNTVVALDAAAAGKKKK